MFVVCVSFVPHASLAYPSPSILVHLPFMAQYTLLCFFAPNLLCFLPFSDAPFLAAVAKYQNNDTPQTLVLFRLTNGLLSSCTMF